MALPAGRYGVTKNQLLKIKKLPMNTIKLIEELTEKFDLLGTAAFKNSTSIITDSSDLVESGAVENIIGWGNKNKLQVRKGLTSTSLFTVNRNNYDEVTSIVGNGSVTEEQTLWLIGNGWTFSNCEDASKYFKAGHTYTLSDGTNNDSNQFIQLNIRNSNGVIISVRSDNLNGYHRTFTVPSDLTGLKTQCWLRVTNGQSMTNKVFYPQIEEGSSITSFEPYPTSVEESLAQKCDNTVIAPVENGTTASQAYAVREHFIRNGAFCTVTQAISSGGTLTEGTNYTSGDVADELTTKTGSITPISGVSSDDIHVNQYGRVVNVSSVLHLNQVTFPANVNTKLATISGVDKPSGNTRFTVVTPNTDPILGIITNSGDLIFNLYSGTSPSGISFNFTYMV